MNPSTTDDYAPDSKPYRHPDLTCNYDPAVTRQWEPRFGGDAPAMGPQLEAQRRYAEIRRVDIDAHRAHLTHLAIYGTAPAALATAIGLVLGMELLVATAFGVFGLVVAVALFRS
ncbi:MAG: hypothetical protein ACPG4T_23380, partial [Nannocystaceae bacterium]